MKVRVLETFTGERDGEEHQFLKDAEPDIPDALATIYRDKGLVKFEDAPANPAPAHREKKDSKA